MMAFAWALLKTGQSVLIVVPILDGVHVISPKEEGQGENCVHLRCDDLALKDLNCVCVGTCVYVREREKDNAQSRKSCGFTESRPHLSSLKKDRMFILHPTKCGLGTNTITNFPNNMVFQDLISGVERNRPEILQTLVFGLCLYYSQQPRLVWPGMTQHFFLRLFAFAHVTYIVLNVTIYCS